MENEIKQLLDAASTSDDATVREAWQRMKDRFQMWALTENCIVFLRRRIDMGTKGHFTDEAV